MRRRTVEEQDAIRERAVTDPDGPWEFNEELVQELRANKGKLLPGSNLDHDLLILTSVGAKSLRPRVRPLGYAPYGEGKFILVGSRGGGERHPGWYYNLVAHPYAVIEVGEQTLAVKATLGTGKLREELFKAAYEAIPTWNPEPQKATDGMAELGLSYKPPPKREYPVFLLETLGNEFRPSTHSE